jgi:hypothetical protein
LARGKADGGIAAPNVCFNRIEITDEGHAFLCNGSRAGAGDLDQLATGVGPAVCKLDAASRPVMCYQPVVSGIAVHLQDAAEALQYPLGMLPTPPRSIDEGHIRRCCAALRSIIAGQGRKVANLDLPGARIECRRGGLVHEQLGRPFQIGHHGIEGRVSR